MTQDTIERDPLGYAICQKSGCQRTYGLTELKKQYPTEESAKNIKCPVCGGKVTDKDGRAWLSANPTRITTITVEELAANKKRQIEEKEEEIRQAQRELTALKEKENDEY